MLILIYKNKKELKSVHLKNKTSRIPSFNNKENLKSRWFNPIFEKKTTTINNSMSLYKYVHAHTY